MSPTACDIHPLSLTGQPDPMGLALMDHLLACDRARGRTFQLSCLAERLHDITAPRFFTTVCAAAGLVALLAGCA